MFIEVTKWIHGWRGFLGGERRGWHGHHRINLLGVRGGHLLTGSYTSMSTLRGGVQLSLEIFSRGGQIWGFLYRRYRLPQKEKRQNRWFWNWTPGVITNFFGHQQKKLLQNKSTYKLLKNKEFFFKAKQGARLWLRWNRLREGGSLPMRFHTAKLIQKKFRYQSLGRYLQRAYLETKTSGVFGIPHTFVTQLEQSPQVWGRSFLKGSKKPQRWLSSEIHYNNSYLHTGLIRSTRGGLKKTNLIRLLKEWSQTLIKHKQKKIFRPFEGYKKTNYSTLVEKFSSFQHANKSKFFTGDIGLPKNQKKGWSKSRVWKSFKKLILVQPRWSFWSRLPSMVLVVGTSDMSHESPGYTPILKGATLLTEANQQKVPTIHFGSPLETPNQAVWSLLWNQTAGNGVPSLWDYLEEVAYRQGLFHLLWKRIYVV